MTAMVLVYLGIVTMILTCEVDLYLAFVAERKNNYKVLN